MVSLTTTVILVYDETSRDLNNFFTIDKSKIVKNMMGGPENLFTIDKFSLFTSFTNDKFNCM